MMKNLFLIALLFVGSSLFAQNTTTINENTTVRDSSGIVLPYIVWQKLTKSGDYTLKRKQGEKDFTLYKLSAEEKVMLAQRKKNLAATMPKPQQSEAFKEGSKFYGERISDINGNKYDLKKLEGKIYVINFWFINCPPCKAEIPQLNEIVAQYKDRNDVVFIGIALDDYSSLKEFLKTTTFNYNVVADGKYFTQRYGVKGYPTHLIIGKDGLIKFSTLGLAPNTVYWIEKTIAEQLTASTAPASGR